MMLSYSQRARFGPVVACIGAQLADNCALGCGFERQGHDNALDIIPFVDDELLLSLSRGPDDCITVLAWVFEADQGSADFIVQILVAGRELVCEQIQQGKIDFIGTVRIGRMNLRLDVRRVVEQDVEHVMAFVLVCSDDVGIDRDVVGDQSVGNHSFLKTEVFR